MMRLPVLQGVLVPMLTPILENDTIDFEGARRLAQRFLASDAVNGLFAVGSTAEFSFLSPEERIALMAILAEIPRGGKVITVNIGGLTYERMLEFAKLVQKMGFDAAAVPVPAELEPSTESVVAYFEGIAVLGVPFMVYWTPMAKNHVPTSEIIAGLMKYESFVGFKDSSRDMVAFTSIAAAFGDEVSVFQGVEMLHLPSLAVGSAGVVGGGLNMYPKKMAEISANFKTGNLRTAQALQLEANRAWDYLRCGNTFRGRCKQYWRSQGVIEGCRCRAETAMTCGASELEELKRMESL